MDWRRGPYEFGVPEVGGPFFRWLTSPALTDEAFVPDCHIRKKYGFEDWATYQGFSAWDDFDEALDYMKLRNENGGGPNGEPFTHIAEFTLKPKRGHACAPHGPRSHHSIWAPPNEVSSRRIVFPKPSGRE